MHLLLKELKDKFLHAPRTLFIIDGCGALLSAILLGLVLTKFESLFGIPLGTLYLLAAIPVAFVIYDFLCFKFVKNNISSCLKLIAYANILYCCLSIALVIYHLAVITFLGWAYITLEVMVVVTITCIELTTATKLKEVN